MSCPTDGTLRGRLDGELSAAESVEIEAHLATCAGCRERAGSLAVNAEHARQVISVLAPLPGESPIDPAIALARFKAREQASEDAPRSLFERLFGRRLRPAWAALGVVVAVAVLLSFRPPRSWAQKILAMLRIQKIAVVPIETEALSNPNGDTSTQKMIAQMLSDEVVVTLQPGEPRTAPSAQEASQLAGFKVRLPAARADAPELGVEGEGAFHLTLNRDRLQAILQEAGRSDLQVPPSADGATIAVHIPRVVVARYGNCPSHKKDAPPDQGSTQGAAPDISNCLVLMQVPSPTVSVPPDLNIEELAEAGLQLAGMSADQAHAFCQSVDWTSTLVIPLPRFVNSYQKTEVDGVEGTLIDVPRLGKRRPAGYTLLWVKNGIIYSLTGFGSATDAVPLADSLD